jgi:hypothetical protein
MIVIGFVSVVCVFTLTARSGHAQQTSPSGAPPPPPPRLRDPFADMRERRQLEAELRDVERVRGTRRANLRDSEAAVAQLREDFRNIQILRNNLVRHLQSAAPLDYKVIAGEAKEINKRAARLKTHLLRAIPESEKTAREKNEQPPEIGDSQMPGALASMCRRIDSFTLSPVFKDPGVIDLKQSDEAGRDLRDIIRLSGDIKRAAEKLNKMHRK